MKIHVQVTGEDIQYGKMGKCFSCPIAIASSRATGREMGVDCGKIWFKDSGDTVEVANPWDRVVINAFVGEFDAGGEVRPIEFDIEIPNLDSEMASEASKLADREADAAEGTDQRERGDRLQNAITEFMKHN